MDRVFFFKSSPWSSEDRQGWSWWLRVWTPVVIAVLVICAESTDVFSSQNTGSFLRPVVERWFGAFTDLGWESFHHHLRKTGHFVGYGTVGFTFLRAWLHTLYRREPSTLFSWRLESTILAIFSTAIVASADEIHQTFIPSRTGTPIDVLLDTAGACVLCLIVWLFCWSRSEPAEVWD
jgi:VanZ family protein